MRRLTCALAALTLYALVGAGAPAAAALLYSIDRDTNQLVVIRSGSGEVTPLGALDFSPLDTDLTRVGESLYVLDSELGVGVDLVELDRHTGATLSSVPVTSGGVAIKSAEGLTQVGGQLVIGFDSDAAPDAFSESLGDLAFDGTISGIEVGGGNTDFDGLGSNALTGEIVGVDVASIAPLETQFFTVERGPLATDVFVSSMVHQVGDIEIAGTTLFGSDVATNELVEIDLATNTVTATPLTAGTYRGLAVADAALLCNGSFEVGVGETVVPCWNIAGNAGRIDHQGATDGSFSLNFNGGDQTPDAVVSQTVATVPGVTYELSFDYGAFSDSFPGTLQELGVQATGVATLLDETIDDTASDPTTFESFVFQFTADSDTTTIVFTDLSIETLSVDGNLDDVRLLPLICGDGAQTTGEQCDDGNTADGDGCSAACEVEGGASVCGDGVVDAGEQCDDGNMVAGDGCDALCQNEGSSFVCAPAPIEGCLDAAKASVSISEKKAGKEKWKAKLKGFGGATGQSDLGDPLTGTTRYDLCLYDGAGQLAAELSVDRAGQTCGPKQKPCFKDKSGKGWLYKDPASEASGTKKLALASGPIGKGKATWQAGNKAKKGQTSLPTGAATALAGATSATLQLITSDAACLEASLGSVKKAEGMIFKAKAP